MLFAYTYVPHQMEKMQEFIDFIFHEVWCKAPVGLEFTLALFDAKPDLKEVLSSFGFAQNAPDRGKQFYKEIKTIYGFFEPLTPQQIDQFKQWYKSNNEIEKVCNNDPSTQLARYSDIATTHKDLAEQLGTFFKGLYSQSLLKLKDLKAKIGDIDDHYKNAFVRGNSAGKCPFCGISDMKGTDHQFREAYDHFLPKAIYPFNSINLRNLAPACHECNSTYKNIKDPVHKDATRRKAFYPYALTMPSIEIKLDFQKSDIAKLTTEDINLQFGPAAFNEQIETWKEVYGIEERYKAKLCTESDGKAWLVEVLDEWRWYDETAGAEGKPPDAYLRDVSRHAQKSPFTNAYFLKKPFLDACKMIGLFEAIPQQPAGLEG